MKELALITHFYNAAALLRAQLVFWRNFSPDLLERIEIIVVDDCSDEPYSVDCRGLPLRLLRVTTDIDWNMAGCRNLAAAQAAAPWLLFFDIDNTVDALDLRLLLNALRWVDRNTICRFHREWQGAVADSHVNTFLVWRETFDAVGGYDEDFCGHYGYEDTYFMRSAEARGFNTLLFTDITFHQAGAPTRLLNRDLSHNLAVGTAKVAAGFPLPASRLRFDWVELTQSPGQPSLGWPENGGGAAPAEAEAVAEGPWCTVSAAGLAVVLERQRTGAGVGWLLPPAGVSGGG